VSGRIRHSSRSTCTLIKLDWQLLRFTSYRTGHHSSLHLSWVPPLCTCPMTLPSPTYIPYVCGTWRPLPCAPSLYDTSMTPSPVPPSALWHFNDCLPYAPIYVYGTSITTSLTPQSVCMALRQLPLPHPPTMCTALLRPPSMHPHMWAALRQPPPSSPCVAP
jgi:hypothetical protein